MVEIEKRSVSLATMLKVFVGLIITSMVVVFVNTRRLGWVLGWI